MNFTPAAKFKKSNILAANRVKEKMPLVEIAVVIFFGLYYLLPSMSVEINFLIPLFLAIGYSVLVANGDKEIAYFIGKLLVCAALISLLYLVLVETSTISIHASNYTIKRFFSKFNQMTMFFFPIVIFERVTKKATLRQKQFVAIVYIAIFAYVAINTTIELLSNEDATRAWALFSELNSEDIGTYAYVYAVPIIMAVSVSMFYFARNDLQKAAIILIVAAMLIFLVIAQYTLALLVAFIAIVLQVNNNIKRAVPKLLLWGALLIAIVLLPTIFNWLASVVGSSQISSRLREVANFFGRGDASGYNLNARITLYWRSFVAFLQSPIIGNRTLGFDGHATFLTLPADIGIFGALAYFFLFKISKEKVDLFLAHNKEQFTAAFVSLVIIGFTNPIHGTLPPAFAVWVMAPLLIQLWGVKNEK